MKNALIIGAGLASEKILDEILQTKELNVKGILDKDSNKFGTEKKGTLILGNYENIESYVSNLNIEVIIIATTEMSTEEIKEKIQKKIDNKKTVTYILPNIEDLDTNKSFLSQLRNVNIPLSVPNLNKKEILKNLEDKVGQILSALSEEMIQNLNDNINEILTVENEVLEKMKAKKLEEKELSNIKKLFLNYKGEYEKIDLNWDKEVGKEIWYNDESEESK